MLKKRKIKTKAKGKKNNKQQPKVIRAKTWLLTENDKVCLLILENNN